MATNEIFREADNFSAAVPAGTLSGAPVLVLGAIPAICQTKEGEGGNIAGRATVTSKGVHSVSTTDAVSAEGTKLYITSANAITTTATANTLFGYSVHKPDGTGGTKSAGAGTVYCRLAKV